MPIAETIRAGMGDATMVRAMFDKGTALRAAGRPVWDLSLGNPVMEPPRVFQDALQLAARPTCGAHRYTPNAGFLDTRQTVATWLSRIHGVVIPPTHVIMTVGAAGALNVSLRTLCDPGDEVLCLAPYFLEYGHYCRNFGLTPVFVDTDARFQPDGAAITAAITPRTRVVLLNSPNNPTGAVYDAATLRTISEILQRAGTRYRRPIYCLMDAVYHDIAYDGPAASILTEYPHTILAYSFSKSLAIPGERIGCLAVHPAGADAELIVDAATIVNRTLGGVNAPALMQIAVRTVLLDQLGRPDPSFRAVAELYRPKRNRLAAAVRAAGFSLEDPAGAFYLFPRIPGGNDDVAFAARLVGHGLLVVPGSLFGRAGHVRMAYCVDDAVIDGAIDILQRMT